MTSIARISSVAVLSVALAIGPATVSVAQNDQTQKSAKCPGVPAAIVGGVLGALLGRDKHRATAAVAGAVVATIACAVINSNSTQTKSGDDALREYQEKNGGNAPSSVVLTDFRTGNPPSVARNGSEMQIQSAGTLVVPPSTQAKFSEQLLIYAPGDTEPSTKATKDLAFTNGGGFANSFRLSMQKDFPQGTYRYKTQLMMNDSQVLGENQGTFQAI